ncbi:FecR family protein [Sunxiuqinia sp. sy24]|uniref:FecR family protein n=1 Tax=Sunxiuqinia sp. sy24 TaxID=3461495 RepID=UPI0040456418
MKDLFDIGIVWNKVHQIISAKEDEQLDAWINESSGNKDYYHKLFYFFKSGATYNDDEINVEKAKKKVTYRIFVVPKILRIGRVAAFFIGIVAAGFLLSEVIQFETVAEKNVRIDPGRTKATLILSDGSKHSLGESYSVELKENGTIISNSGSELSYEKEKSTNSHQAKSLKIEYNTLNIPRGGEFSLSLSDGTKVWLNSETILTYPLQFGEHERVVELIGEAYFEVKHNSEKPFRVKINGQIIEVLGTSFNISSYPDESESKTTLVNGSVRIRINESDENVVLEPGYQCVVNRFGHDYSIEEVSLRKVTAWKDGNYIFEEETLETMISVLSRWYDFTYLFKTNEARNLKFSGKLKRTDKFEDILTIIERTNEVKFKVDEKNVIIY